MSFIRLRRIPRPWPWRNALMRDIPFQRSIYHASADFAHRWMTHRSLGAGGCGFGGPRACPWGSIENRTSRDSSKIEKGLKLVPFRHLIGFGLIVVTAFLAYSNSFHVPFQFDDRPNIVNKPDYENGHNSVRLIYKKSRQWDKAIRSFQEELRRHPENVYTHLCRGLRIEYGVDSSGNIESSFGASETRPGIQTSSLRKP
jgi:hypothetical protein